LTERKARRSQIKRSSSSNVGMASDRTSIFSTSRACTFGELSAQVSSTGTDSTPCSNHMPLHTAQDLENPFRVLMNMPKPNKVNSGGGNNLILDLDEDRWIHREEHAVETPTISKPPAIKRSSTVPSHSTVSPMADSSSKDPISSLFADRAARYAKTEKAARQAEIEAEKAAKAAEEARLKARRERVERLAKEQLEDSEQKRGKEWDRRAHEEKVRAQAVMEVEKKKKEDMRERERIKRNIADDEERRRLARQRLELKYGRRLA